jgi:hypothetical protein
MLEMVEARRNSTEAEQRHDLFTGLLDASQNELDYEAVLSDDELIGGHLKCRNASHFLKASYSPS